jgi:hypothetical protein
MSMSEPKFEVNERVYPLIRRLDAHNKQVLGTVIKVYSHGSMYRNVVKFDDGKEEVFFDFELMPT